LALHKEEELMSEHIDNASGREEKLKAIIRQLHAGASVDEVKLAFADLLEDVGPDEVVRIEEALVAEGLDPEEIQPLCDVHVAVFRDALDRQKAPETVPGHPVFTYRAENLGVRRALERVEEALAVYTDDPSAETREAAQAALARLREYDKHYLRKENLLFPFLERTGFTGPSKVMWGVHDQIREMWKALGQLLSGSYDWDREALKTRVEAIWAPLKHQIGEMVYKEENILFPAALGRLNDADWAAIHDQGEEIGYAYARPGRAWVPGMGTGAEEPPAPAEAHGGADAEAAAVATGEIAGAIALGTGVLTVAQVDMMLRALPVDVTFVDENDEVRYFSQSRERIFQRSPAIIGRKVQNCHPPQSVDRVQEILDDFRAGRRDEAAFWIRAGSGPEAAYIYIVYYPLRDADGAYRGTIEVTQNIAPLRKLEGEKRLLD
jgi:uncharacterized protein